MEGTPKKQCHVLVELPGGRTDVVLVFPSAKDITHDALLHPVIARRQEIAAEGTPRSAVTGSLGKLNPTAVVGGDGIPVGLCDRRAQRCAILVSVTDLVIEQPQPVDYHVKSRLLFGSG